MQVCTHPARVQGGGGIERLLWGHTLCIEGLWEVQARYLGGVCTALLGCMSPAVSACSLVKAGLSALCLEHGSACQLARVKEGHLSSISNSASRAGIAVFSSWLVRTAGPVVPVTHALPLTRQLPLLSLASEDGLSDSVGRIVTRKPSKTIMSF